MDAQGKLGALTITMRKNPASLDLDGPLAAALDEARASSSPTLIIEGSVRDLAPLAPRNVNSMATGAIAARHSLGFDGVVGRLIADPRLEEMIIDVDVEGVGKPPMTIRTSRANPAPPGAVTGQATLATFFSSLLVAARAEEGDGVHLV